MNKLEYKPVVEVTRGNIVESVHYGAAAVVDADGRMFASYGDPDIVSFLRSSSKPIQVLPLIEEGGAEKFKLSDREIAIMCASHSATEAHVETIEGIQRKVGVGPQDLLCGVHFPQDPAMRLKMQTSGAEPNENHNNCSGKHTGMLTYAKLLGESLEDYINPSHHIQVKIKKTFAEMCGVQPTEVELGVDGCSAPVFAVPLRASARSFARLCDPKNLPAARADACRKITNAMISNADMVAGPGKFDSMLIKAAHGKLIAKSGAEGYLLIGIMPGVLEPKNPGLGIAIKIADGDMDGRARSLTALEILCQMCVLTENELEELKNFGPRPVKNWRGVEVGRIRSAFTLQFPGFTNSRD